jgi:hypothetical protein
MQPGRGPLMVVVGLFVNSGPNGSVHVVEVRVGSLLWWGSVLCMGSVCGNALLNQP